MTNSTNSFFFCAVLELSFTNEHDWLLLFFFSVCFVAFPVFFSKRMKTRNTLPHQLSSTLLSVSHCLLSF